MQPQFKRVGLLLDQVSGDVAYAWRGLGRSPVFTMSVAFLLTVGIGVNAGVIGIIDTAFLRKLPVPAPDQLTMIYSGKSTAGARRIASDQNSFFDYQDIQRRTPALSGLAAYDMQSVPLTGDLAGTAWAALVTGNYFDVLRIQPQRGRFIRADEASSRDAQPVVVISDAFWREQLGADEHAVGSQLMLAKTAFTILGIAPPHFTGTHPEGRTDLWLPLPLTAQATGRTYLRSSLESRDARRLFLIGRLAPSATLSELQQELDATARDLGTTYPLTDKALVLRAARHARLVEIDSPQMVGVLIEFVTAWLMVALLHLIACSNVASLLLARAAARRHELAVRMCLGASQWRLMSQALTESVLLGLVGSAGALVVAQWIIQLICKMQFMSAMDAGLDWRLVTIVVLVGVASSVQFGLFPALDASRRDPASVLRGAASGRASGRDRSATLIVVGQFALSLVLLVNAGVLARSFAREMHGGLGYDADHLVVASIALGDTVSATVDSTAPPRLRRIAASTQVMTELLPRLRTMPGVVSVAPSIGSPLSRPGFLDDVKVADHAYSPDEPSRLYVQLIGPGYFSTLGARMIRGREFDANDRSDGTTGFHSVVVNESMARRYWPNGDAVGKHVSVRSKGLATVIGIVADVHDVSPSTIGVRAYLPLLEQPAPAFDVVLRVRGNPEEMAPAIRSVVTWMSPRPLPPRIRTVAEARDGAVEVLKVGGIVVATCGGLALLLTVMGLFGLVSQWAAARRLEIGIRLALGAPAEAIHAALLSRIGRPLAIGTALGVLAAAGLVRMERASFGPVFTFDPLALVGALLILATAAGLAGYLPSRRASRMAPSDVLRAE